MISWNRCLNASDVNTSFTEAILTILITTNFYTSLQKVCLHYIFIESFTDLFYCISLMYFTDVFYCFKVFNTRLLSIQRYPPMFPDQWHPPILSYRWAEETLTNCAVPTLPFTYTTLCSSTTIPEGWLDKVCWQWYKNMARWTEHMATGEHKQVQG